MVEYRLAKARVAGSNPVSRFFTCKAMSSAKIRSYDGVLCLHKNAVIASYFYRANAHDRDGAEAESRRTAIFERPRCAGADPPVSRFFIGWNCLDFTRNSGLFCVWRLHTKALYIRNMKILMEC